MERVTAEFVEAAVRSLIAAKDVGFGIEVSTPVAYPSGDLVNVIVESRPEGLLVHDAGFAAERLALSGIAISRHLLSRLGEYAHRFNCVFENRRITAKATAGSIELAVAMVANASRSVADYSLELRRHAEADFRIVVTEALREIVGARVRENEEFQGKSGRKYRISATVLNESETAPAMFIAPIASHAVVPHGFSMLYDLQQGYADVLREAIYDETSDLRPEDRALLRSAAEVHSFSEARVAFQRIGRRVQGHA